MTPNMLPKSPARHKNAGVASIKFTRWAVSVPVFLRREERVGEPDGLGGAPLQLPHCIGGFGLAAGVWVSGRSVLNSWISVGWERICCEHEP